MTDLSNEILNGFWEGRKGKKTPYQMRETLAQKEAFWALLIPALREAGYSPEVKLCGGLIKSRNIVIGDPDTAKLIFTAHYDTCAVLPFPNFNTPRNPVWFVLMQILICLPLFLLPIGIEVALILLFEDISLTLVLGIMYAVLLFCIWWVYGGKANHHTANDNTSGVITLTEILLALPLEQRDKVCAVFFDHEEQGLFGSAAFARAHKELRKSTLVINFDCVSDGDYVQLFPSKAVKNEEKTMALLEETFFSAEGKEVEVVRGYGFYPSDQRRFHRGVGVCALKKNKLFGYYLDRIHTRRDTRFDERNITLLRDCALRIAEKV